MAVLFSINFGCAPGAAHPNLNAWLARTGERPAVKAEVEGMTADAARIQAGEKIPEGPRSL